MRLNVLGGFLAAVVLVVAVLGYGALFTVPQTRQAIVVRLGEPVDVITDPGLHVKWPLIESVIYIDKRILDLENPPDEFNTSDQKKLVVDAFARYRVTSALNFYQKFNSVAGANAWLGTLLNSALRSVVGNATLTHVVRDQREQLMGQVRDLLEMEAKDYGITVVDVRIRRADLPPSNSQAVYKRMQTELQREAAQYRAEGSEKSQEIRAKADREVTVLIANATNRSEQIRGEGDGERNRVFADAFGRDQDFFVFYRTMQAYEASLRHNDTRMLLKPDSDFFRFFGDPMGKTTRNETSPVPTRTEPSPPPTPTRTEPSPTPTPTEPNPAPTR